MPSKLKRKKMCLYLELYIACIALTHIYMFIVHVSIWHRCTYCALTRNSWNPNSHLGLLTQSPFNYTPYKTVKAGSMNWWAPKFYLKHTYVRSSTSSTSSSKGKLFCHGNFTKPARNTKQITYTYLVWIHIIRSGFEPCCSHITRTTPARRIRSIVGSQSRRFASEGLHSTSWRIRVPKRAAIRPLMSKVRPVHVPSRSTHGVYTSVRMSSAKICRESRVSMLMIHGLAFKWMTLTRNSI